MLRRLIVIGASAGGPGHFRKLLGHVRADALKHTAIVIVQHMHANILAGFVKTLSQVARIPVSLIRQHETEIQAGHVYVLGQNACFQLAKGRQGIVLTACACAHHAYFPSFDCLLESLAHLMKEAKVEVEIIVLTGMGDDGVMGVQSLRAHHKRIRFMCEDARSALINGMPEAVSMALPSCKRMRLQDIIQYLNGREKADDV